MSDKQSRMRQRRHGFLEHQRRLRGEKKAVSPVVATLILILIAVAAAAALYLWLVVWQGNITGGIGTQHAEPTLQVGGSTSVYPFSSLAATWFEQNNSDVVISDNQGGTGAGMVALCDGNVDLGASSTPQTVDTLEASYGCSPTYASTITITTIAYDAVDVVVAESNSAPGGAHGLLSISADTLNLIYEADSSTEPSCASAVPATCLATVDGATPTGNFYSSAEAGSYTLAWDQIPAAVGSATIELNTASADLGATLNTYFTTGAGEVCGAAKDAACLDANITEAAIGVTAVDPATTVFGTGTAITAAVVNGAGATVPSILCSAAAGTDTDTVTCPAASTTAADVSQCGFAVCAGGGTGSTAATEQIIPISRSDASGTTQTFEAKLLGYGSGASSSSTGFATTQEGTGFSNLGYGGCGSNNLLSDCGFTYPAKQEGDGNPGVLADVVASPNAIGYASDGLARTTTGIGVDGIIPFLGLGQGVSSAGLAGTSSSNYQWGGVVPTTGTSGTIAAGLTASTTAPNYVGGRPFQLISLEPLTGIAQEWVTFITDPAVNAALASATAEVGLYQVV